MDLKELNSGVDPKTHWYYQSKKKPLLAYFKKIQAREGKRLNIIDFGSGSGFFARELLEAFPDKIGDVLLVDIGYSEEEIKATENQRIQKSHFIPEGYGDSLVVMMDVLEHIEDDKAILQDIKQRLGSNAHYFITVPAFMSLWSGHDVYLEHYRRYTLPTLKKLVTQTGLKTESGYYIYGSLFPVAWLVRRFKNLLDKESLTAPEASDMRPLPMPVNELLKQFNLMEMGFRYWNKLFGITAVSEGRIK